MSKSADTTAFKFTRAGSLEPNPTLLRQRTSAALADAPDGATFVTIREGAGLGHYVVLPSGMNAERSAFALAKSVAANSAETDPPNLSGVRNIAYARHDRGSIAGSNTQLGADIQAVVDVAATSLRDGEWVAFSVRRPKRSETKRNRKWLEHRSTLTHHSLEVSAVVISMWAGADGRDSARGVLARVVGALPGFDLRTKAGALSKSRAALPYLGIAAIGMGAGVIGTSVIEFPFAPYGFVLGAVAVLAAVLVVAGVLPSAERTVRRNLGKGMVPPPPVLTLPPAPPKRAGMDKEGNPVAARDGDYPLHPQSFLVGAVTPVTLIAPHAGAESGGGAVQSRIAPPVFRNARGPLLGDSGSSPAYLSAADAWQGLMSLGEAGSGKSALLQAMWGYDALVKTGKLSAPDGYGQYHTMIAFDTKGDAASADEYVKWSESADDNVLRIDFSDESSPVGIEMFPTTGSAVGRARRTVTALKYTFGETSIGPESFDTLTRVFVGAYATTPDVLANVPSIPADKSPFFYANVLLTSRGDDLGKQLANAIRTKADVTGDEDAREATDMLGSLYDPQRTPAQRQQLVKAPRNKMEQLVAAEHWWSRPKRASWKSLLEHNTSVVINLGASNGFMADTELTTQVAALMMFTLHEEIQRTCIGWFEQRRMVSIYADELKHIAGTNAQVVSWIRNDARSFGARGVFATQFPQQLEHEVRSTVMGFGTLVCFKQGDARVISEVLESLKTDESSWTSSDIFSLPQYEAVVRSVNGPDAQTPFTVRIPNFRAMRGDEFVRAQGGQPSAVQHAPNGGGISAPAVTPSYAGAEELRPLNPVYMGEQEESGLQLPSPTELTGGGEPSGSTAGQG